MKPIYSKNKNVQLLLGLLIGIAFGFLLQKGQVIRYDVIIRQLLLEDFTVLKIMLTATATGMVGVYLLKSLGLARLHPKPGSAGMNIAGGLMFGAGFAVLGYCPGTIAGAVGNGYLDAIVGGLPGMLLGAWLFAVVYPRLSAGILNRGYFGPVTFPELMEANPWALVFVFCCLIGGVLLLLETAGL
jgi:hypothetical protein